MIRNLVFDMGQVLIRWDPALLIGNLGVPEADVPLLCREVFGTVEWVQLDRGTITREAAFARMARNLPERLHQTAEAIMQWWNYPLRPMPGMEALLAESRELGYGVYLLSNATSDLHGYFSRIPGSQYFDGKIVSADWKLLKPQREIYETLYREHGLKPEECFFVDDMPVNIEGAGRTGMPGTVFYGDMLRLRRDLREAGVMVKEDAKLEELL